MICVAKLQYMTINLSTSSVVGNFTLSLATKNPQRSFLVSVNFLVVQGDFMTLFFPKKTFMLFCCV